MSLICLCGLAACSSEATSEAETAHAEPARVENARPEADLATIHLDVEAEIRLGIETSAITTQSLGATRTLPGEIIIPQEHAMTISAPFVCESYPIGPDATAGEAVERTLEIFPRLLVDVLESLRAGTVHGRQQDADAGCYYCKRYPWDGEIDWDSMEDVEVHNLVRSLNGPGLDPAFSHLSGHKIEIVRTRVLDDEIRGPARRLALQRAGGVVVICKNRGLLIEQIAVDGELTAADDFLPRRGASFDRAGYWRLLADSTGLGLLEAAAGTRTE